MGDDMKNEKYITKLVRDAFTGKVNDFRNRVDKLLSMKANVLLNKQNEKIFKELFK